MAKILSKFIFILFLIFFVACSPTIKRHIRKLGYTPLEVPRNFNGEGTIFRIVDGKEIVWRAPHSCFPDGRIERFGGKQSLPSRTTKINTSINLMNFVEDADETESGLKMEKVIKTSIVFEDAFSKGLPVGDIVSCMQKGEMSPDCIRDLVDKENYLIVEILGVKKMSYEFIRENNVKVELSPNFIKKILKIKPGIAYERDTKYRLVIDFPCYIGYKTLKLRDVIRRDEEGREIIEYVFYELPKENMKLRKKISVKKK